MNKVLFLTYYFPPIADLAAHRSAKFAKYLSRYGYEPIVVCAGSTPYYPLDPSSREEVAQVRVLRTRWNVLPALFAHGRWARFRRRIWPDADLSLGWLPLVRSRIDRIVREEKISLVYTSCAPFWINMEGLRIRKRFGIPWVTDFRDPWISNPLYRATSRFWARLHKEAERRTCEGCDYYIANTPRYLETERRKYPVLETKSTAIPNGYDSEDFKGLRREKNESRWVLGYLGSLYDSYNPGAVFDRLSPLLQDAGRRPFLIQYAGPAEAKFMEYARAAGLGEHTFSRGIVSHRDSLQLMVDSDLLFLFVPNLERARGWVPGKLYEYIASRTPVYGVLPTGDAGEILTRSGAGLFSSPEEPYARSAAKLGKFREVWEKGRAWKKHDWGYIHQFERRKLTRRLAEVFDRLT